MDKLILNNVFILLFVNLTVQLEDACLSKCKTRQRLQPLKDTSMFKCCLRQYFLRQMLFDGSRKHNVYKS